MNVLHAYKVQCLAYVTHASLKGLVTHLKYLSFAQTSGDRHIDVKIKQPRIQVNGL